VPNLRRNDAPAASPSRPTGLSNETRLDRQTSRYDIPARLELPLLDPELRRDIRVVATDLLDEALGVLAADEHFERVTKWEAGREGVVDDGVDDHSSESTLAHADELLPRVATAAERSLSGRRQIAKERVREAHRVPDVLEPDVLVGCVYAGTVVERVIRRGDPWYADVALE